MKYSETSILGNLSQSIYDLSGFKNPMDTKVPEVKRLRNYIKRYLRKIKEEIENKEEAINWLGKERIDFLIEAKLIKNVGELR